MAGFAVLGGITNNVICNRLARCVLDKITDEMLQRDEQERLKTRLPFEESA